MLWTFSIVTMYCSMPIRRSWFVNDTWRRGQLMELMQPCYVWLVFFTHQHETLKAFLPILVAGPVPNIPSSLFKVILCKLCGELSLLSQCITCTFLLTKYRKVASSRPVYYSIFDHFWGATNQDVLLSETCYYC